MVIPMIGKVKEFLMEEVFMKKNAIVTMLLLAVASQFIVSCSHSTKENTPSKTSKPVQMYRDNTDIFAIPLDLSEREENQEMKALGEPVPTNR